MKNILIIGSLNMDFVIHSDTMPKLGETLAGYGFASAAGGKGANQAAAAAKLGANVKMLGAVGDDDNGRALLSTLSGLNTDCSSVIVCSESTGVAVITLVGGDNFIIIHHGANFSLSPDILSRDENRQLFRWADIVVMQLEIPMDTVREAAALAKANGAMVVLNPAPMDAALDSDILQNVDLLIPNEHEAALLLGYELAGEDLEERSAKEIYSRFGCRVIITLGSQGSLYYDGKEVFRQRAFPVKAVDTTAAGDSFIGGLCTAIAEGASVTQAMGFASAVSACAVSKPGAIPSLPDRQEVDAFVMNVNNK